MEYVIREACRSDYRDISDLVKEIHNLHVEARPNDYKKCDNPLSEQEYYTMLENDSYKIFVAVFNNLAIGYTILKIQEIKSHPILLDKIRIHMDDLCVTSTFRRKGIGKALYLKALEFCKEKNINQLELNVWGFNIEAIKFYKSLGMTEKFIKFESNQ